MVAANIWHWWIGVGLTLATVGALLSLVVGYFKKVVSPQYPNRRQRQP